VSEPVSPVASRLRQPKWLDARLLAGVLLILVAVLVGANVVSSATKSREVWALKRTLRTGMRIEKGDLQTVRVRLFDNAGSYVDATRGASPVGRVLARDVSRDELLPIAAILPASAEPARRLVTVPVSKQHALAGDLARGDLVDIVATFGTKASSSTRALLKAVPVEDVVRGSSGFGATGSDLSLIVSVEPADAVELVSAVESGTIDVLKVVPGSDGTGELGGEVAGVGASPSATPS
jgi:hypothetical protein